MSQFCHLCESNQIKDFYKNNQDFLYYKCCRCDFVFLSSVHHLDFEFQKITYDHHENSIENSGYVNFLNRLVEPLSEFLSDSSRGLDYGSGPGPTLYMLFEEKGFEMEIFDPIYCPDESVLGKKYDFITCTEVIEHFHFPLKELKKIMNILNEDGIIGVMTQPIPEDVEFADWWYHRDPTHVSFFCEKSLDYLAKSLGLKISSPDSGVYILRS